MNTDNTTRNSMRRALIRETAGVAPRGSHRHPEHDLQSACLRWLRYAHPDIWEVTFAVPNGGRRDRVTAALLKEEGVKPGVADIIVLWHGALCIEMKTDRGRQSRQQRAWQKAVTAAGAHYAVCRSLDSFAKEIETYINNRTI